MGESENTKTIKRKGSSESKQLISFEKLISKIGGLSVCVRYNSENTRSPKLK